MTLLRTLLRLEPRSAPPNAELAADLWDADLASALDGPDEPQARDAMAAQMVRDGRWCRARAQECRREGTRLLASHPKGREAARVLDGWAQCYEAQARECDACCRAMIEEAA